MPLAVGARSLNDLAKELGANADALERLLDACVNLQLLSKGPSGYANLPAAATYLTKSSPHRLTGYINYSNNVMWKLWGNLADAVREGSQRWKQTYGLEGPIFSQFFRDEDAKREFLMGMHGYGLISSPQVIGAFDLQRFRKLVDLGGTGHLALPLASVIRRLSVVFDLPEALPLAREIVGASTVAERWNWPRATLSTRFRNAIHRSRPDLT